MPVSAAQLEVLRTLSVLHPYNVTCGKVRIGGDNDGGYVMANDFENNQIAYSIGVGPGIEWDAEMAARGMHVFQYDNTVDRLPSEHPNFHYKRVGIASNLSDPQCVTLEKMIEDNEHMDRSNMLLKIDAEGAEWDVLERMSSRTLARFDQVVVNYHALEYLDRESFRARAERVFRNIAHTHRCIHVHGNNYGSFEIVRNIPVPNVIEVTYALKSRFEFCESTDLFPTHLDQPCKADEPDLFLGDFKYTSN